MGVGRQGLFERKVAQDGEDEVSRRSESGFHGCPAKLKQGIAFVEMPGQAGADGYSAPEAFIWRRVFHLESSGLILGEMRVKDKQDAAIVLAREFPDHQRTIARGGFPVNMTRAVCRDVIAERVKVLATALRQTFQGSLDARQNFQIFFAWSHGWIDESFRFQIEVAGFLQESKWKASDDAEGFLTIDATPREGLTPLSWRLRRGGRTMAASIFHFGVPPSRGPVERQRCVPAASGLMR